MPLLFLDDLQNIEHAIKESNPKSYHILMDDYEYSSIGEIPDDITSSNQLKVSSYSPSLTLDLRENSANLFASSNDLISQGLFSVIDEVIRRRERKLLWYFCQIGNFFAPPIVGSTLVAFIIFLIGRKIDVLTIALLLIFLTSAAWLIIFYNSSFKNYSRVEFQRSKSRKNFLTRNKDQLLLAAFAAVLGAIITVLFDRLFLK